MAMTSDGELFDERRRRVAQVMALEQNVQDFSIPYFGMADKRQGIVHIIGPEQGAPAARELTLY